MKKEKNEFYKESEKEDNEELNCLHNFEKDISVKINLNQINFSKIYSLNEDLKEENSSSYSNEYQNLKNSNTNNNSFKKIKKFFYE